MINTTKLPETGFLTLSQICRVRNSNQDTAPLIPISDKTWYERVKKGVYPKPIKHGKSSFYRVEDIRKLLLDIESGNITL